MSVVLLLRYLIKFAIFVLNEKKNVLNIPRFTMESNIIAIR